MKRRTGGKLRKLTHKDRAKKASHNGRTDREGKLWTKRHVVSRG